MLSPEYYEGCADDVIRLYEQLEDDIISDVIRRIMKSGKVTATARHRIEQLQEAGILYDDILQKIAGQTDATTQHVRALFEDAGVETVRFDNRIYRENGLTQVDIRQSPAMRRILEAGYRKTLGDMKNLTLTTANTSQTAYINACNQAYMQITSGAFSYQEAIRQAVQRTAQDGVKVLYPSGHTERIDVAVRRAVLTGVGQTCREIGMMNAEECGCDLMEITAHSGARPDHASWQGKIVSLSGRKGYLSKSDIGYGTGNGFGGWNCRHDWYPFFEGYSKRNYSAKDLKKLDEKNIEYNGKLYSQYEISQIQRRYEREIRSAKREQVAFKVAVEEADDPELQQVMQGSLNYANDVVKNKQAKMRDFILQTRQNRDYFREQNYPKEKLKSNLDNDDGILDKIKNIFKKTSLTSVENNDIIDIDKELSFKKIKGKHTQKSDLKNTNPNHSRESEEYSKNCQRCVNAYEARRRGYDVEALPRILDGSDRLPYMADKENGWTAVYKNPELISCAADEQQEMIENVNNTIKSFGENSRAIVRVQWKKRGGHVFIAETIDGKTKFIDPQTNKKNVSRYLKIAKPESTFVMRIDNLEFTDKIFECCKESEYD
ncbi:MAG: phage capsid protein [Ruminococcus sp.]|nr:phage capsid protein [Ruminococcus sp.]